MGHKINWAKRLALSARYGEQAIFDRKVDALIELMGGWTKYLQWYNALPIGGERQAIEAKYAEMTEGETSND